LGSQVQGLGTAGAPVVVGRKGGRYSQRLHRVPRVQEASTGSGGRV